MALIDVKGTFQASLHTDCSQRSFDLSLNGSIINHSLPCESIASDNKFKNFFSIV